MMDSSPSPNDVAARRRLYRRAALAPVCLCLVASLHAVRVATCQQTPWKGGGFGMFSTVDSESARFVRCFAVTDAGEWPLPIPPAATKAVAEIQAAPTQHKLEALARRLADQPWRWRDQRQIREAAAAAAATAQGIPLSAPFLRQTFLSSASNRLLPGAEHLLEPVSRDAHAGEAIRVRSVRVECFRYRYNRLAGTLSSERVLAAKASVAGRPDVAEAAP